MTGIEYTLSEVMEPHLFVFRKQKRDSPEKVTPMLTYYVLDGSIYQAPQLCNVFASRVVRINSFLLYAQLMHNAVVILSHQLICLKFRLLFLNIIYRTAFKINCRFVV